MIRVNTISSMLILEETLKLTNLIQDDSTVNTISTLQNTEVKYLLILDRTGENVFLGEHELGFDGFVKTEVETIQIGSSQDRLENVDDEINLTIFVRYLP
jgi:hypothetical protein